MRLSLYQQLCALTEQYYSDNAHSLIDNLIESHLNIDPIKLTKSGLTNIYVWLEIATSLLNEDLKVASKYQKSVKQLIGGTDG